MSLPRAIIPGRRYLITRCCSERRFLMRPDRETNNAFIYCMALAARKTHVGIVCVGTTSNHGEQRKLGAERTPYKLASQLLEEGRQLALADFADHLRQLSQPFDGKELLG